MSSRSKKKRRGPGPQRPARQAAPPPAPKGRSFLTRSVFGLGLVVVVLGLLGLASLHRIAPEERAFRRAGGEAIRLEPGWRLAIPFLHQVVRVPAGVLQVAGDLPARSREGVSWSVPYSISAEIDDTQLVANLNVLEGADGPLEQMRRAGLGAMKAWAADLTDEAIVLGEGVQETEDAIRERLESSGFQDVVVDLGRATGPDDMRAAIEARAMGDRITDTGAKVAIIGLDGADWQIIDPLIAQGRMPNLARLKQGGAWGNMRAMSPMLSPLLWTSVATGKPPEQHGIIDFLVRDPRTGGAVPVSSRWRKVKALWNIYTDAGRDAAFIAWWATWPAEEIRGHMVSDRVAYSLFGYEADEGDREGATHPPSYFRAIRPKLVDDSKITLADVQQFARVSPEEFVELRHRVEEDPKKGYREPVNHLTKILASTRSYHAVALDVLSRGQPGLFAVYYQGIDEVCHRFAHFMPPKMEMATDDEFSRYRDTVDKFYEYQDRLLGELLAHLSSDTTVIVLSDHGFRNGSGRPTDEPPYIEGNPGLWHRRYGIVVFYGPTIRPGRLDTTGLLDVAPTVLYLSGLPVAEDMGGRVVEEAIDPRFMTRFPIKTVPSYELIGRPLDVGRDVVADSAVNDQVMEQLRALGYISSETSAGGSNKRTDGSSLATRNVDGEALITGHLNEASLRLNNKDYKRAEAAVEQALKIAPEFVPALILQAQIAAEQKQYDRAIEKARRVITINPEGEPQIYGKLGQIFSDSGRLDEGLAYYRGLAKEHPGIGEIHSAIGAMLLTRGDTQAAEQELLAALRLNPALGEPLAELHKIYQGTERILSLEGIVRKGLEINDKSVVHHNWMGLIYQWKKDLAGAEREFLEAIELDPDYAATMANLGALYGRSGRLPEAVEILTRAVGKDPDNIEAWVNLGAAQGRMGQPRAAIDALETALEKGARSTTLFNALALAHWQAKNRDKALQYLEKSLAIDPDQEDVKELMAAVNRSS